MGVFMKTRLKSSNIKVQIIETDGLLATGQYELELTYPGIDFHQRTNHNHKEDQVKICSWAQMAFILKLQYWLQGKGVEATFLEFDEVPDMIPVFVGIDMGQNTNP